MAEQPSPKTGAKRRRGYGEDSDYDNRFTSTPDPWSEIAKLQHGGDRTFATTVQSIVVNADPAQRPGFEDRLLKVLANPQCTPVGRQFVARLLALIGSAKCVPALAPLLNDVQTADTARYALDHIKDPAVDAAYRAALERLSGPAKIGLIGSIGLRGDRAALPVLTALQQNASETPGIREAAGRAVARLSSV